MWWGSWEAPNPNFATSVSALWLYAGINDTLVAYICTCHLDLEGTGDRLYMGNHPHLLERAAIHLKGPIETLHFVLCTMEILWAAVEMLNHPFLEESWTLESTYPEVTFWRDSDLSRACALCIHVRDFCFGLNSQPSEKWHFLLLSPSRNITENAAEVMSPIIT